MPLTVFEKVYWARRSGAVRRFHTQPFQGLAETVFHHSASTAMLLVHCVDAPSAALLRAALMHDLAEGFTGDLPAPMRWLGGIDEPFATATRGVEQFYGWEWDSALTARERVLLDAADFLDCVFTVREQQRRGNHAADVMLANLTRYNEQSQLLARADNARMTSLWEALRGDIWPDVTQSDFWQVASGGKTDRK